VEEERRERGIVVRERAGRDLVRDTDVVYDVANTVVSKSRVSVPGGASGASGSSTRACRGR